MVGRREPLDGLGAQWQPQRHVLGTNQGHDDPCGRDGVAFLLPVRAGHVGADCAGVVLAEVQSAGSVTHQRAEALIGPLLPPQADAGKVAYEVLEALSRGSDSFPQRLRPVYDTAQRTTLYLPTDR